MCGRSVLKTVVVLAVCGGAAGGVGEIGRVWGNDAERQYPPAAWIPPGADRSQFAVVSSQPFAVVERTERPAREQREAWRRQRSGGAAFTTAEAAWRRQRSDGPAFSTAQGAPRRRERPVAFTTAEAASDADAVLERYPGTPQLWSPYTEDPAPAYRKKPLFAPDTGFLLEHGSGH